METEGEVTFTVPGLDTPCKTWYKVLGDLHSTSRRPLVVLHGGPGATHEYLLPLGALAHAHGIPIVFYDQLGCGRSTRLPQKNGDEGFWTETLFVDELRRLLEHLGLGGGAGREFDVLGHSWGGMLGSRWAATRPEGLRRLVLADSLASIELWLVSVGGLRKQLPQDVQDALDKHEAEGTTDSQEYQDAVKVFYRRHMCRLDPIPKELLSIFKALEEDATVYGTMFGPSEFYVTGTLRTWSVVDDLPKINVPTLLLNGRYDEAQDIVVKPFFRYIPKARWYTFAESSHLPHVEEKEKFMQLVGDFLTEED